MMPRAVRDEATLVVKKLRPLLRGFQLGAIVAALAKLEGEYMAQLIAAEALECDCLSDSKHGLYKCKSRRAHAVTTLVGR
jgi:hypothetical protein